MICFDMFENRDTLKPLWNKAFDFRHLPNFWGLRFDMLFRIGGGGRIRTGVKGFAGPRIASLLRHLRIDKQTNLF